MYILYIIVLEYNLSKDNIIYHKQTFIFKCMWIFNEVLTKTFHALIEK